MGMVDGMGMGRGIRVRVGMDFGVKGGRGYGMSLPLRPHENQLRPLGSQRGDVAPSPLVSGMPGGATR